MIVSEAITDDRTLPWSTEDEQRWDSFLQSDTGKRLIPKLLEQAVPSLLDKGHVNAILIRSGEVRGVQQVVTALIGLSHSQPQPPKPSNDYPAPEDDTAWQDGQKLEVPKPQVQ